MSFHLLYVFAIVYVISINYGLQLNAAGDASINLERRRGLVQDDAGNWVFTAAEKQRIEDIHNMLRRNVKPPADPPLAPLRWNDDIAGVAQRWAATCEFKHSYGVDTERGRAGYGENIGCRAEELSDSDYTSQRIYDMVEYDWGTLEGTRWEGIGMHPYDDPEDVDQGLGHYTAIIWATTTELGCGIAQCDNDKMYTLQESQPWWFFVCNYNPPGNLPKEYPYTADASALTASGTSASASRAATYKKALMEKKLMPKKALPVLKLSATEKARARGATPEVSAAEREAALKKARAAKQRAVLKRGAPRKKAPVLSAAERADLKKARAAKQRAGLKRVAPRKKAPELSAAERAALKKARAAKRSADRKKQKKGEKAQLALYGDQYDQYEQNGEYNDYVNEYETLLDLYKTAYFEGYLRGLDRKKEQNTAIHKKTNVRNHQYRNSRLLS